MSDSRIDVAPLPWTGERYLPEVHGSIELEHVHRYLLASRLSVGKRVLDIACGEGYGSAFLAQSAMSVVGVDIAADAVAYARSKYQSRNLDFRIGSCAAIPLPDHSVDVVVSFETIEHHREHDAMMLEIKRVLVPEGILVISSPDRLEYSDKPGYDNPYHVRELYRAEFAALLSTYFRNRCMSGQRIVYGSAIFNEDSSGKVNSFHINDKILSPAPGIARALYLVAIASDAELPMPESGILEQPIAEADDVRERIQQIAVLSQAVSERDGQIAGLLQTVTERDGHIGNLNQAVAERDAQIVSLAQGAAERDAQISSLAQAAAERDAEIVGLAQAAAERDARIVGLDHAVAERDGQIVNLVQAAAERDGQIVSLVQAAAERDGQIVSLVQAAAERDGQIVGLVQAAAERDGQIVSLNQAAAERDGQIVSLNQAVAERDGQIVSLNQAVAERDERIVSLNQAVAERDERIVGHAHGAAERDGQIAILNQAVADRDGRIAGLDYVATEREELIVELNDAIAERDGEIAGVNQQLAALGDELATVRTSLNESSAALAVVSETARGALAQRDLARISLRRVVVAENTWRSRFAALQRDSESRVTAAERDSESRVAAVERDSELRIAAVERDSELRIVAVERDSELRIVAVERDSESRVAAVERESELRVAAVQRDADEWRARYFGLRGRLDAILHRYGLLAVARAFPRPVRQWVRQRVLLGARKV